MPVTTVPAFPLRSQGKTQAQYSSEFEASMTALPLAIADLNAVGSAYALATNATSSTSNTIGTGSKSFTTQLNLGYQVGQSLRIAASSVNFMTGEVTSYNTGTGALVMNISSVVGTGTFTSWFISQSASGASSAGAVSFTPAGSIAATNVQTAIQELDTEKLSSAAGAVTGTNLEDIITASSIGSLSNIPAITYDANGRITAAVGVPTAFSGKSMVRVNTPSGNGSTNTSVRRFSTVVVNQGSDITYADSATLGGTFTINTTGCYAISYTDAFSATADMYLTLNSTTLNAAPATLSQILSESTTSASATRATCSVTVWLTAGDVIRAQATNTGVSRAFFTISRVA